jgi:glycosyltransferase involved in cell wall biosynthesis
MTRAPETLAIAILLPDLGGGGAERLSLLLAREFARSGHQATFILQRESGTFLEEARQYGYIRALGAARPRELMRYLPEALREMHADALIANIWPLTFFAALAVRSLPAALRPRTMLVEHNPLSQQYRDWNLSTRLALTASQAVACRIADVRAGVSRRVACDTARLAHMRANRFVAIHNPVELAQGNSAAESSWAEAFWPPRPGRRYLAVGSLKLQKNFASAIDAFSRIRRDADRLVILGEGELRAALERQVKAAGLSKSVLLPGFISNPAAIYRSADVFVLSSDYEGFGNVVVEALAAGLPVVATDCGGAGEILEQGRYGTLVPVGDTAALAAAMDSATDLTGAPHVRRSRALEFAPDRIAAQYLALLSRS